MRRRLARPYGLNTPPTRMLSLLMGLVVLGVLYQRAKEPQFWRWLTNESRAAAEDDSKDSKQTQPLGTRHSTLATAEDVVPGPNETDPDELEKLRSNLKAVQDRQPLQSFDMPAYWQLMRWSRTRPFAEQEKLSRRDVPYSHLWEEPDLYRGQPIRLKLYVRRVLKYEPSKNPQDLKTGLRSVGLDRRLALVSVLRRLPRQARQLADRDGCGVGNCLRRLLLEMDELPRLRRQKELSAAHRPSPPRNTIRQQYQPRFRLGVCVLDAHRRSLAVEFHRLVRHLRPPPSPHHRRRNHRNPRTIARQLAGRADDWLVACADG